MSALGDFPWVHLEGCERCGQRDVPLCRVVIEDGRKTADGPRMPRAIHVCRDHSGGVTNGQPVQTPRNTTAKADRFPQLELFDTLPFKRAKVLPKGWTA